MIFRAEYFSLPVDGSLSAGPPKTPLAAGGQHLPHTLAEALAATYSNQPALQAERAKLRATDETVPTALAGWRPTVILAGSAGYALDTSTGKWTELNPVPGTGRIAAYGPGFPGK